MAGFFTKEEQQGGTRFTNGSSYQYAGSAVGGKMSSTPKALKSTTIGSNGGVKKPAHYHTLTQGSGYGMMPGATRAHTASTRPTTTGSMFDVYMHQGGGGGGG